MKISLVVAAIAGLAFGAPSEHRSSEIKDTEIQRAERSYGAPPCAGAGGYATPVSLYLAPQAPLAPLAPLPQRPLPQYREDEKHEGSSHTARWSYESPLPALPAAGGYGSAPGPALAPAPSAPHAAITPAPSAGGSAVGVFPNAKVGGCNVPLLLSCSPQVITGHLAESHYAAPAYRHVEEPKREARNTEAEARVASHHKVSEDYPEPHPGNHHLISQDFPEPNLTRITLVQPQNQETKEFEKNN